MNPSGLTVAVIIPVYNGGAKFRTNLDSVRAAHPPPDELLVISDGDTDGSSQYAETIGVPVYHFPSPGGPARARNLGASKAKSDILFFIDADVTIPTDTISQVVRLFQREPELAALIGSYDDDPGEITFLSQYRNLLHHYVHQTGQEEASTFWGACGAIRRDVFLSMGGFDETYRKASVEDIELGYRLKRAGYKIRLCKSLQVKHLKRWEFGSMLKTDFFQRALPWTALILRDRRFVNDLNISTAARTSVTLTGSLIGLLALTPWQPWAWVVACLVTLSLLALNASFYKFLFMKRGVRFAAQAVPFHWLHFLFSGVAFALGIVRHLLHHDRVPQASTALIGKGPSSPESRTERHR